ncbi:MAG: tetratricopeptide repeat protein [Bacteroidota bacterium]
MKLTKLFFISSLIIISTSAFSQSLQDAIKLTTNEQFEKADAAFKNLLSTQPANGEIYFYHGENYFKNNNMEMAKAMYQKGADVNATNPFPYVGLGKVQWYQNMASDAKANFYKATTLAAGKNATVLMLIAEAYIEAEAKDFAEVTKLLDQAQKLEPTNPRVFLLKGDAVLEQSNDGSKAIAFYEQAAKLNPKSVDANLSIGQLWNRAKNYTAALDYYKKAKLIDSTFAPAYREMAEIYGRAGQYTNAVANYKRYLELNNDCSARAFYAGFQLEGKHYTESIEAAKEALKCDSNNVYLYRYLAYASYEVIPADYAGGLENSNKFFSKVKPETKVITKDYEYRAKLLAKGGKDSLAILDFMKALELQPDKIELNSDIGALYVKMKKYNEAIATYNKKIEANKANINDYFGLARAFYFSKDFVKSDSAAAAMIRLQPDMTIGYLWRAKANVQLDIKNERWAAKPYYEQFIAKIKPEETERSKKDLIEANNYLGVHYLNNKDFKTAKTYFQKILELDPKYPNAVKFMASPEAK